MPESGQASLPQRGVAAGQTAGFHHDPDTLFCLEPLKLANALKANCRELCLPEAYKYRPCIFLFSNSKYIFNSVYFELLNINTECGVFIAHWDSEKQCSCV